MSAPAAQRSSSGGTFSLPVAAARMISNSTVACCRGLAGLSGNLLIIFSTASLLSATRRTSCGVRWSDLNDRAFSICSCVKLGMCVLGAGQKSRGAKGDRARRNPLSEKSHRSHRAGQGYVPKAQFAAARSIASIATLKLPDRRAASPKQLEHEREPDPADARPWKRRSKGLRKYNCPHCHRKW